MGDEEVSETENIINESESEEDFENNIDDNMVINRFTDSYCYSSNFNFFQFVCNWSLLLKQ